MGNNLEALETALQYRFQDGSLLKLAMTHRSFGTPNNERLEFLGDSLLNFFIGEALFQQFPNASEGELSRLRSNLVKGETLAKIAAEQNIAPFLILGQGELKSGGLRRASILADAIEAIIAAVYLDKGASEARKLTLYWFTPHLQDVSPHLEKDPKTILQEYLQRLKQPLPEYRVIATEGSAHDQIFTVECEVKGLPPTIGIANGRRKAEQIAAEKAFQLLRKKRR